jgi:hypothetical protein
MKIARILLAVAAFAATSQASWYLGSAVSTYNEVGPNSLKYSILSVLNETSCNGAAICPSGSTGTTAYTVFYVAPAGGTYAGEAIVVNSPARADSKQIIAELMEAYRNGWKIQVTDWNGAGTPEVTTWQNITRLYRVKEGDKILVATHR